MTNYPTKKSYFALALLIAALLLLLYTLSIWLGAKLNILYNFQDSKWKNYFNLYSAVVNNNLSENTLIILANNAEIRTGGGFIGTVGILNSNKSKINIEPLIGVYGIDSSKNCEVTKYSQEEYLKSLSPCPSLRDSSNDLDFTENAKKALYFYQLNTNKPVKNVVQITPEVLEKLLEKLGPVYLKEYDITVSKDNFRDTIQLEVEAGKDKQLKKDPKSGILGSLANQLLNKLINQNAGNISEYISLLDEMIVQKHLVMYSENTDTENFIRKIGASGEVNNYNENYFMYAEANFSAKKNSPYIKNEVDMYQQIQEDGSSIVDITINTFHSSDYKVPYVDPNTDQSTWLVAEDKSYITSLIPKNSTLITFTSENNLYNLTKTEKGNLLTYVRNLNPLQKTSVRYRYKIPTNYVFTDRLVVNSFIQKQTGGWPYTFRYSLSLPNNEYQLKAANVNSLNKSIGTYNTVVYTGEINTNQVLSFIYEKK